VPLTVPVLHDDTIVLRPPEAGDAAAIAAAVQDPDIPRFTMVPSPYTVDDAVAYLEGCAARWSSGDAAPFVITDGATGTLLGSIGLHDLGVGPRTRLRWQSGLQEPRPLVARHA
jgi:RimJ/RimL family protein N-acetyltransferase